MKKMEIGSIVVNSFNPSKMEGIKVELWINDAKGDGKEELIGEGETDGGGFVCFEIEKNKKDQNRIAKLIFHKVNQFYPLIALSFFVDIQEGNILNTLLVSQFSYNVTYQILEKRKELKYQNQVENLSYL